jgi:hypothetical protein
MLVLATCGVAGVCSDMHGEGVAACGWLYSAPPARAVCGGTRRGAAGSVHRLCRCVHGAPRHGLRASTVSNRQPRGSRFPGHAPAAEWAPGARDPIAVAAAASRSGASERARAATWKMLESPSRYGGVWERGRTTALCDADAAAKRGRWWRPRGRGPVSFRRHLDEEDEISRDFFEIYSTAKWDSRG